MDHAYTLVRRRRVNGSVQLPYTKRRRFPVILIRRTETTISFCWHQELQIEVSINQNKSGYITTGRVSCLRSYSISILLKRRVYQYLSFIVKRTLRFLAMKAVSIA